VENRENVESLNDPKSLECEPFLVSPTRQRGGRMPSVGVLGEPATRLASCRRLPSLARFEVALFKAATC